LNEARTHTGVVSFFMAKIVSTLTQGLTYLNTLLELDSTAPASGEEDFTVWTNLLNIGVNLWENEEGVLWKELFVKLADAPDGTKTTTTATTYTVPALFRFPASGYVWLGSGTNKTAYKVIKQEEVQLNENNTDRWCYFLLDGTPTLEFNPNLSIESGQTISYNYYKTATAVSVGADTFEMSDPMFAVYYALSELTKEEGNAQALNLATQKMEAMKTRNEMPAWFQEDSFLTNTNIGFGV
jgi:hypothetical protein